MMGSGCSSSKRKEQPTHESQDDPAHEQVTKKQSTLQQADDQAKPSDPTPPTPAAAAEAMSAPAQHAEPSGDCTFCCDDFTSENYVEYQAVPNGPWLPSIYCQACIEAHFINAQWAKYLENIAKADCAAALRRVLSTPPQINVKDPGLKCEGDGATGEVVQFWYASDGKEHSAKLAGSLVGAERDAFWAEKQAFLTATELQEEIAKAEAKAEQEKAAK